MDYGLYRLVTAYREHGHQKANVDVLQLKQTMLVTLVDSFILHFWCSAYYLHLVTLKLPLNLSMTFCEKHVH